MHLHASETLMKRNLDWKKAMNW